MGGTDQNERDIIYENFLLDNKTVYGNIFMISRSKCSEKNEENVVMEKRKLLCSPENPEGE